MELLDDHHLDWEIRTSHNLTISASPTEIYDAILHLDMSSSFIARLLFRFRGMPVSALSFEGLQSICFVLLGKRPPLEIALGIIGRLWTPSGGLVTFAPEEFRSFSTRGYAKASWGFALEARNNRTLLRTETRVSTTDPESSRLFRRYWRLVKPFSGVIRRIALHQIAHQATSPVKKAEHSSHTYHHL